MEKKFEKFGLFCKNYRMNVMQITLKEFDPDNVKTISSFENGRSTNINHLFTYLKHIEDQEERIKFMKDLLKFIEGDHND